MIIAMARKTKEDAQKTRDQILNAAELVFYSKGFTLTTMTDIAEAAKLSRGAIYGHYKGKLEVAIVMAIYCTARKLCCLCNIRHCRERKPCLLYTSRCV